MMEEMTPRDRVLRALSHRTPDKVPRTVKFTPAVQRTFEEKTGGKDYEAYFNIEIRFVGFKPLQGQPDFSRYYPEGCPEGTTIGEYGQARYPANFHHFTGLLFPMRELTEVEELEIYPWPDVKAPYRHQHLEEAVAVLHRQGYFVAGRGGSIFEIAWQLIGYEKFFMDIVDRPEFITYILDRLTEDCAFRSRRLAEADVDMVHLGDDVGMEDRMMMSPDMWRNWLKPRLAKVIRAAKEAKPDVHISYHSDGYIEPIIPDLIEIGVDVLNPVQPECMDPAELKRRYGDQLSFWGTIGTQTTMPFGTPEEVKETVKHRIETVGQGGGLILAPTHVLESEVPWENIVAFFEAIDEYGTGEGRP